MRNSDFSWIIIAFAFASFLWTYSKIFRVRMMGIKADAVVTRMEEHETMDSDGLSVNIMILMSNFKHKMEEQSMHAWPTLTAF